MSAVAVKQGDAHTVQVTARDGEMQLYVGGVRYELVAGDSPLIVGSSGVVSSNISGGIGGGAMGDPMAMAMMTDQIFVRMDEDGAIVISTGEGASLSVSLQADFLAITVEFPESFHNMTSGLLGVFNGNQNDDYRDRSGNVLNLNDTEEAIYRPFGLQCKC